ncbi:hypothetical protein U1Q18_006284 [Sarracenia purpurea var. burkii]
MEAFRRATEDNNLTELGPTGSTFTWSNQRRGTERVREKLDRALVNAEWAALFPFAEAMVTYKLPSDHLPLCIYTEGTIIREQTRIKQRIFRFEQMWTREEACKEIIKENWGKIAAEPGPRGVRRKLGWESYIQVELGFFRVQQKQNQIFEGGIGKYPEKQYFYL